MVSKEIGLVLRSFGRSLPRGIASVLKSIFREFGLMGPGTEEGVFAIGVDTICGV